METGRNFDMASRLVSGETSGAKYDVFLNFRGPDTRDGFVDCLYEFLTEAGLRVFMDNEELRAGELITREIPRAIDNSKLFVPVFSKDYVSSKWCLQEIGWMVECMEEHPGKEMLPVFYDVDPSDVKLKSELYTKALLEHEENFDRETVQRWRKALIKVPEVKGWKLTDAKGQGRLIKQIAREISSKLKIKHRVLPNHLIGLDHQLDAVMKLLDCGSADVLCIVIHGMGGIGKTTLAKAVFNKICHQFQCCGFLSDIRESSQGGAGILKLQEQLLRDLLMFSSSDLYDTDDWINKVRGGFVNRDVLIVLDNVSNGTQLVKLVGNFNWLGPGSRVIVTTRDLRCLGMKDDTVNRKIFVYNMMELGFVDAVRLFSWHAFGEETPPYNYKNLSSQVLAFTRGNPLALKVVGQYLCGQNERIWKEKLKRLRKATDEDLLRDILLISYESLLNEEKEIFLDIACFFAGKKRKYAFYYWEACDFFPEMSIGALVSLALVKIDSYDVLMMHDLLKDLGREVVRQEDTRNPGKRSWLWHPEDIKCVLSRKEGSTSVRALKLSDAYVAHDFTSEELGSLPNLTLLELCGGNFTGNMDDILSQLRWLSWDHFPKMFQGTNFYLRNLVFLRISRSDVGYDWSGWQQLMMPDSLRVLELDSLSFSRTPDLSLCLTLERLVLHDCAQVVEVDSSIRLLQHLKSLRLLGCNALKGLPEEIGCLKALRELQIVKFSLEKELFHLPRLTGQLASLSELRLHNVGITQLPDSIGELKNLRLLNLFECSIRELPTTIGHLEKLEVLKVICSKNLEGEIPCELGGLRSLKILDLSFTNVAGLPQTVVRLTNLRKLYLTECNKLRHFPDEFPASLTHLRVTSKHLAPIPNLSNLTDLVVLELSDYENSRSLVKFYSSHRPNQKMPWIQTMQKLEYLRLVHSRLLPFHDELVSLLRLRHLIIFWPYHCSLWTPLNLDRVSLWGVDYVAPTTTISFSLGHGSRVLHEGCATASAQNIMDHWEIKLGKVGLVVCIGCYRYLPLLGTSLLSHRFTHKLRA